MCWSLFGVKFLSSKLSIPVWQWQDIAHNHWKSSFSADGCEVDTSIGASLEDVFIYPEILPIATAYISHKASDGLLYQKLRNLWPGTVAGSTEMRRYLLVHLMHMCLFQALRFSDCLRDIRRRWNFRWMFIVVLWVALRWERTITRSVANFAKRKRDSCLSFK